jgi:hypothetical protein
MWTLGEEGCVLAATASRFPTSSTIGARCSAGHDRSSVDAFLSRNHNIRRERRVLPLASLFPLLPIALERAEIRLCRFSSDGNRTRLLLDRIRRNGVVDFGNERQLE